MVIFFEAKQVVREESFVFFPQFLGGGAVLSIKAKTALPHFLCDPLCGMADD
jgi:hypothetical protein